MHKMHKSKVLVFLLVLVMVVSQASMLVLAAPGVATVQLTYLQGVNPSELTVKVAEGALAWNANDTAKMTANGPVIGSDGTFPVIQPGWFTLYSKGEGFYTVTTYFEVTSEQVAAGETVVIRVENNKNAGAKNHDPSTTLVLPPYQDMYGDDGNWTIQPKKEGVDNIFALGSDVAPWTGPDHFQTPAFKDNGRPFYQFTSQEEMDAFIAELNAKTDFMYVYSAGRTPGFDNDLPLVIFTKEDLTGLSLEEAAEVIKGTDRPTYFHGANIHGNEQSAGEGALAFMYDMAGDYGKDVIEDIDVIVYPRINPDGHQANTRAVLAVDGVQPAVDPNRDHQSFKSEDIWLLHKAWNLFLPHFAVDGHELGGWSYSVDTANPDASVYNLGDDMQSTPATGLNIDPDVTNYAIATSVKQQQDAVDSGIRMYHYTGNGTTNNNSIGRAYYANMGAASILVETRGQRGGIFKRRVYTQYMTARSFIDSIRQDPGLLKETVDSARDKIIEMGKTYDEDNRIVLYSPYERTAPGGAQSLSNPNYVDDARLGIIQRYNLKFDGTYDVAEIGGSNRGGVLGKYISMRDRSRPTGYVVPKDMPKVDDLLRIFEGNGIEYLELVKGATLPLEQYYISSKSTNPHANPGAFYDYMTNPVDSQYFTDNYFTCDLRDKADVAFPNGAYFIPMDQVAGTIIALTMEPDIADTATYGGSFVQSLLDSSNNNILGGTASNVYLHDPETKNYPIYRFTENDPREFAAPFVQEVSLKLSSGAGIIEKGDTFGIEAKLNRVVNSNTGILTYTFDTSKFEYAGFSLPNESVKLLGESVSENGQKVTLMIEGYDAKDLGQAWFKAKDVIKGEAQFDVNFTYVSFNEANEKAIYDVDNSIKFTTWDINGPEIKGDTNNDGVVDLIDLSNMIDWFGVINNKNPEWASFYTFFDYNASGDIDIFDVVYVAKLIAA